MKTPCITILAISLSLLATLELEATDCWNKGQRGPAAGSSPPPSPSPTCPPATKGGSNSFNVASGTVHREVTDVELFGGIGEEKLAFRRLTTSRYIVAVPTPLGAGGSWRHSYFWHIYPNGTDPSTNNEIIHVDYPDGGQNDFWKKGLDSLHLTTNSAVQDRIERVSSDLNQYYLWFADGKRISFRKQGDGTFKVLGFFDKFDNWFEFGHDAQNRVTSVTEPGGRFIEINYGTVGTESVITQVVASDGRDVEYQYETVVNGGTEYLTLRHVNYSDGTSAHYTYVQPFNPGRPLLSTTDDPRATAQPKMRYTFQTENVIEGFLHQEINGVTGAVMHELSPPVSGERTVSRGDGTVLARVTLDVEQPTGRTDSVGRTSSYTYFGNGDGFLHTYTDARGTYTYDRTFDFGATTHVAMPGNRHISMTYTDNTKPFYLATETDELGRVKVYTRDPNTHKVTRIDYKDAQGNIKFFETFEYDPNNFNLVISHRMLNGYTEYFTYYTNSDIDGKAGDIKTHIDGAGNTTTYTYNALGQLFTVKDPINPPTCYFYDERGNITKIIFPDTTEQRFGYDTYGNRTSFTNELNKIWTYDYDEFNRLTSVTDPLQHSTLYGYELPSGCSSCHDENKPTSITLPSLKITKITYDAEWRKTRQIVGYGTAHPAITDYFYEDTAGNLTRIVDPRLKTWRFAYDPQTNWRTSATDPLLHSTTWTYYGNGTKETELRSGDTNPMRYFYDVLDHVTDTIDQAGNTVARVNDGAGNVLTITAQNDAGAYSYSYTYDGMNRKTLLTYPGGTTEQYHYNAAGNLDTYTNRRGQVQTLTYDSRNREYTTVWSNGAAPDTTKQYDDAGRLQFLSNGDDTGSAYGYDDANRLTEEWQNWRPAAGTGAPHIVRYTYDVDDNRESITYPDGSVVSLGYTGRNQVKDVTWQTISGVPADTRGVAYSYDGNGNRLLVQMVGAEATPAIVTTFDDANRLVNVLNFGNPLTARFTYGYNASGTRKYVQHEDGTGDTYGYDAIDQITAVKYGATNPDTNPTSPNRSVTYDYDAAGNRRSVVDGAAITGYTPNNLNQYTVVASTSLQYDADGNLTSQPTEPTTLGGGGAGLTGWTYEYDALNRLIRASGQAVTAEVNLGHPFSPLAPITSSTTTTVTFAYDARNRCVSRTVNGVTTYFYYDGWNLIEERNAADQQIARYIHGPQVDEVIARITATGALYYRYDGLGSVTALTDEMGVVLEKYNYDVYGQPTITNAQGTNIPVSAFGNRFMFTGREWISEIGLYDYRNRIYSPVIGRFLQTDPIRFDAGDVNLYRYVFNDPVDLTDPSGRGVLGLLRCAKIVEKWQSDCFSKLPKCDLQCPASNNADEIAAALEKQLKCMSEHAEKFKKCLDGMNKELQEANCATQSIGLQPGGRK